MTPTRQFIVQHNFSEGWGYLGENLVTMDDVVDVILDYLGDDEPVRSKWLIELIERDTKLHVTDITNDALATVARDLGKWCGLNGRPLPAWHPQYQPPEQPVRRLADIVGAQI
jgi:hypothetical protein